MTLTPSETVLILRRRMKLTQAEFGKLLGVSWKTVQHWELGNHKIKQSVIEKLEVIEARHVGSPVV